MEARQGTPCYIGQQRNLIVEDNYVTNHYTIDKPSVLVIGDQAHVNLGNSAEKGDVAATAPDMNTDIKVTSSQLYVILPKKPYHHCRTRTRELHDLTSCFESMTPPDEAVVMTLFLTGCPGSGKTQLGRQFGERFFNNKKESGCPCPLVLTLNADSAKSLLQSAKDVMDLLRLTRKPAKEGDNGVDVVRSYLEPIRKFLQKYQGEWLLILDNMFHRQEINTILPQPGDCNWGRGKVLVTTQDNALVKAGDRYARSYRLDDGMEKEDAKSLLQDVGGAGVSDADSAAIDGIAEELNYSPLSLACAAVYVCQTRVDRPSVNPWENMLAVYRDKKDQMQYSTFVDNNNVYPRSMAIASRLAVERMANCSEVLRLTFEFLSYCSLNPVPLDAITHYVLANLPEKCDTEAIKREISGCSLLIHGCPGFSSIETIAFHQVISYTFKQNRTERDANLEDEEMREKFLGVVNSMNASLTPEVIRSGRPESVDLQILLSAHFELLILHAKSKNWIMSEEFVIMSVNVVRCLYHVPGVTDAQRITYLKAALEVADGIQLTGINHCYLLEILGFYHREMHQLEKSEQLLEQALTMTEGQLHNEAWLALRSSILKILSWTYKLMRKLEQAVETMEESIGVAREVHGPDCEEIVEPLCELAIIYRDLKEMAKAKERVDEARGLAEKPIHSQNLKRAKAFSVSGKIYLHCSYGEEEHVKKNVLLESSRRFHAEALKIYQEVYGEDHLDNAGVLITYAMVTKELGDSTRAMDFVESAMRIYTAIKHEIGLCFANSYKADILLASGRVEEATRLLSKSLGAKFLFASLFRDKQKFCEARIMFHEVLVAVKEPGHSMPSRRWIEQATQFRNECDVEISRMQSTGPRVFLPVPLVYAAYVFLIAILIGLLLRFILV